MSEEIPVYNLVGEEEKRIGRPRIFDLPVREDIISRLFFHQITHRLQPKGRYPLAGRETSAEYFGVGLGIARIPRYKDPPLRGRGAIVAMARGGRRPHAPTAEKNIYKKINRKELKLATASAVAATARRELVAKRGHRIDNVPSIPLIVTSEFANIAKSSEAREVFRTLGLWDDVERVAENIKIVGGKASWRGRRRKVGAGPLIVYLNDGGISRAVRNFPGVDVVSVDQLTLMDLAPGGVPGRLVVWIEDALPRLEERFGYVVKRHVVKNNE